jgi:hypothetical protein
MPSAFGEKQEIVDMIGRKCFGLLACHIAQIVVRDSRPFESACNENLV